MVKSQFYKLHMLVKLINVYSFFISLCVFQKLVDFCYYDISKYHGASRVFSATPTAEHLTSTYFDVDSERHNKHSDHDVSDGQ